MIRLLAPIVALAAAAALHGETGALAPFSEVTIKPATATVYVATVSMTMPPFARKGAVYSSTYVAKVFPYFVFNEKGRIWITLSEADLLRAAAGEAVTFTGKAISESGSVRRVEGRAAPNGPRTGTIRVKVYVSRRISLTYDTSYRLTGPDPRDADSSPRKAR